MKIDLSLLDKLISIDSVYPHEKKLALFIEGLLKKTAKVTRQKVEGERFNLLAEKGIGKRSILLYCHLDTIAAVEGWKTDPFKLEIKGDKAYGLGAWDMKGGMLASLSAFLQSNPKEYKLKIAFCVDEENISKGGYELVNSEFMRDVECVISTEPAFFYDNRGIVIGRPGRAVYDIEIKGTPKHYAFYDSGSDINIFTARFLMELKKINRSYRDKKQFVFVRKISSETVGMSTPHSIHLEIDSSILPPATNSQVLDEINLIAKKVSKQFNNLFTVKTNFFKRETPFLESYQIDKNNKYLNLLGRSIAKITGQKPVSYFRSSIADENVFGSHGKTVFGIGASGGNAHSADEWVSIESLNKLYNIINDFLYKIL